MKKICRYCHTCWVVIFFLLVGSIIHAQEPPAANGKISNVNGLKIYYEETGQGTPLVLLHGFKGTSSFWRIFTTEFARFYRVIAVDLPGHGRSDYMDSSEVYSHKKAAEYILGLLHELKLDSAYVIGGSSGGMIALYMATIEPGLTRSLVVIAGQTYYSRQTRNLISSLGPGTENPTKLEASVKNHGKLKGTLLERQFWNFRKLYGDPSFTPDVLATIRARTLIIHGDNDPIAPRFKCLGDVSVYS